MFMKEQTLFQKDGGQKRTDKEHKMAAMGKASFIRKLGQ